MKLSCSCQCVHSWCWLLAHSLEGKELIVFTVMMYWLHCATMHRSLPPSDFQGLFMVPFKALENNLASFWLALPRFTKHIDHVKVTKGKACFSRNAHYLLTWGAIVLWPSVNRHWISCISPCGGFVVPHVNLQGLPCQQRTHTEATTVVASGTWHVLPQRKFIGCFCSAKPQRPPKIQILEENFAYCCDITMTNFHSVDYKSEANMCMLSMGLLVNP